VLVDEVSHTTALVERVVESAVDAWRFWALGICLVAVDRGSDLSSPLFKALAPIVVVVIGISKGCSARFEEEAVLVMPSAS
jgi:hypothetical protein